MFFSAEEVSPLYNTEFFKLYYFENKVNTLFSLTFDIEEEGDSNMAASTSVSKGEIFPLAVRVVPASSDYFDFTINEDDTKVVVQNNIGTPLEVHGKLTIDPDNKTVIFSWDTSKYSIGSYTIVFWISITYNGNNFLIKSDNITRSIKQSSIIG